ncbi:MAG: hypothetical protein ABS75_17755 [Pelagibacterium sp. SCN 63-23]|nr:MAG: hypothetical protein ABS75_17755 [Pelagibacterium sp. SCN 63-23]
MSSKSNYQRLVVLEQQMEAAAADFDFEKAAVLRDEIARLKGEGPVVEEDDGARVVSVGQPPPGAMGLGTHVPVRQPPKGWVKPKKPSALTRSHKGRGTGRQE